MYIICSEKKPLVPWRNGGGLTREMEVYFDKTRHHDFLWRVSMAIVDKAGAFSRFEGIDRTLAIVDGQGLVLKNPASEVLLERTSLPYCFAGEFDIEARLPNGAITDLNVMTRRGFFSHKMTQFTFYDHAMIETVADTTFIICNHAMLINGQKAARFDGASGFAKGDKIELQAEGKAQIFIVDLIAC